MPAETQGPDPIQTTPQVRREPLFEQVRDDDAIPGLSNANALVHDPFAWDSRETR